MLVAFGSDHAGYEPPEPHFKPALIEYICSLGHEVVDCGTDGPEPVDYPDIAECVCDKVQGSLADVGILMCGTGIGMSIAANRRQGIRASVCCTPEMARLAREHNHANVLCIGRRVLSLEECKRIIATWLDTEFSAAERHERRVAKLG